MKPSKKVKPLCAVADKRCKILAAEYRQSSRAVKKRIDEIHNQIAYLAPKSDLRAQLMGQLAILNQMFRTTSEIGREAEHYYEKGWWRSEVYTFNTR